MNAHSNSAPSLRFSLPLFARRVASRLARAERSRRERSTQVAPPAICCRIVLFALLASIGGTSLPAAEPVDFQRDIRPLMADSCFKCHGPGTQKAGLRLDRRDDAIRPAESGSAAIIPGSPERSELMRRLLSTDPDQAMPPPASHKSLTAAQKELFRRWIAAGAPYQKQWSFERPTVRKPPTLPTATTPIDAYLAARIQREGVVASAKAPAATLVRRLAFTLLGIPPRSDEVDETIASPEPDALARLADKYLASPRHGEEMARHWLDVARYGDTHGLHLDNERQMWLYRDWVINAFNRGLSFDQFTIEQLAGDLLPNPTPDQLVATGFNRCNVTTGEGGSIAEEWVFRNAVDRASTTAETWLGLTAGCCVCHDHKFDPLSMRDFYSLYAFFLSAADPPLDGNALLTGPTVRVPPPDQTQRVAALDQQLADLRRQLDTVAATTEYKDPADSPQKPAVERSVNVWLDDDAPAGAKFFASPGHPTRFVDKVPGGGVFSGQRALQRVDKGLTQDVAEGMTPQELPVQAELFAYVWLDPQDPPKTLMLQYFSTGWLHRAVWGDYDAIAWGKPNSPERVLIGPLPAAGQWVRLAVPAERLGLHAGAKVSGFAVTQFGGTVYWDKVGVEGTSDPAADPSRSLRAWQNSRRNSDLKDLPPTIAALVKREPAATFTDDERRQLRDYYVQRVCRDTQPRFASVRAQVDRIEAEKKRLEDAVPASFIFRDLEKPREAFVMLRGQYDKPGDRVEPDVPTELPRLTKANPKSPANRLDLARWLVAAENPLTARVTVNRFWQQVFGVGLVKTSFDFGSQGEPPSHPELLDWLAVDFSSRGWETKALIRDLVLTDAFQRSSVTSADSWRLDPENRWLARGPRVRLDAEQLRDNALAVSGLLDPRMGGRGVNPYQPPNIWEPVGFVGSNTRNFQQDHGSALYRRSVYVFFKRTAPPPFMANFDAPNREQFCSRRERSNTPLQALQLMNDVQHFEAARALATRTLTECDSPDDTQRLAFLFRLVLARRPEPAEQEVLRVAFDKFRSRLAGDVESARQVIKNGESAAPGDRDPVELAAYTLAANLVLNMDETVMRN